MKFFLPLFFLLSCGLSPLREPTSLKQVLNSQKEIIIGDSLLLDCFSLEKAPLDTATGKKLYGLIYDNIKKPNYTQKYFTSGKITVHPKVDILLFNCEEEIDSATVDIVSSNKYGYKSFYLYFIILDKYGNYKNNYYAATYFEQTIDNKISGIEIKKTLLFKDLKFIEGRSYGADELEFYDNLQLHINEDGDIIANQIITEYVILPTILYSFQLSIYIPHQSLKHSFPYHD